MSRFQDVRRSYTLNDIQHLKSPLLRVYASHHTSEKLWNLLQKHRLAKTASCTFGGIDAIQVEAMSPYLETVYVSGWVCSSHAATTNEPGPDTADYPYNTVPNKTNQLFRAQDFHACKQREALYRRAKCERAKLERTQCDQTKRERTEWEQKEEEIDYYRPIIADGDTGFGSINSMMRLTKLFIEAGAAGVHFEDQIDKRCGHADNKRIRSVRNQIAMLQAARLQADLMEVPLVIVGRTDAQAARLLDNNIDPRDHPFILGMCKDLHTGLDTREPHTLFRYVESILHDIIEEEKVECESNHCIAHWNTRLQCWRDFHSDQNIVDGKCSMSAALALANEWLDDSVYDYKFHWDPEACRTPEGYYRIESGDRHAALRAACFAPYCDMIWIETKTPDKKQAQYFVDTIRSVLPEDMAERQLFAYNLSPSFPWYKSGLSDEELRTFCQDIGRMGYVWQFITLAGFHALHLISDQFAQRFAQEGMYAYVDVIQGRERDMESRALLHNKWSGSEYIDAFTKLVLSDDPTNSLNGQECTESLF